jgi:hypothetical protein
MSNRTAPTRTEPAPERPTDSPTGPSTGVKIAIFAALVGLCMVVGGLYLVHAQSNDPKNGKPTEPTLPAGGSDLAGLMAAPHVLFRSNDLGPNYGKVAVVPMSAPSGPRAPTKLTCDRVAMQGDVGVCLTTHIGFATTYEGQIFDGNFNVVRKFPLPGLPSRLRISPDGKYAATTTFVSGDSYAATSFSTRAQFIDLATGKIIANLEGFKVTDNGNTVTAVNRNYWGVTFAADSNTFYATLGIGGNTKLIQGDLQTREAHTLTSNVECPSLSPDQTRVAYKKRVGGVGAVHWRLHVLDLNTGRDVEVAETRSVDDQVEWLDNQTLLYAISRPGSGTQATDTYSVPADGSGTPSIFIRGAWSPSVARQPAA